MKICFIGEFPLPGESPQLGPQNVLYNLVKGITKADSSISIDIVTIRNDIRKPFCDDYFVNVRVHYLPKLKFLTRSFGDPILIRKFLKLKDFDLIHAHYPIALAKILDLKTPKVLTLHGIFHKEKQFVVSPLKRIFFHEYNTYMLKKILPRIEGFVAISPHITSELAYLGIFHKIKKIYHISNPIDNSYFDVIKTYGNNIIFYPANISILKNQIAAIEVLSIIKNEIEDVELHFGGLGDEKYLKTLKKRVNEFNLENHVRFLGLLDRKGMIDVYSKCSLVYLLSFQENQPMVLLEAMSTGNPVIATNLDCNKHIVEDGVTGYLVNLNDKKRIAECTVELLQNIHTSIEMGERARDNSLKRYHVDIVVQQTLNMYEEVMK